MYFKQSDFFSGMDQGFVKDMLSKAQKPSYQAGDIIFREGDQTRYFFILIKGHVKLSIGEDGQTVFAINQPGECFGWSSLINRARYSASAVCVTPTILVQLEKTHVRTTLKNNPANGLIFMERLAGLIGNRLLKSYQSLLSLTRLDSQPTVGSGQLLADLEPA